MRDLIFNVAALAIPLLLGGALISSGCSPDEQIETVVAEAVMPSVAEAAPVPQSTPKVVMESKTIPGLCEDSEVQKNMAVADAEQVVTELGDCDPIGNYFDLAGRFRDDGIYDDYGYMYADGRGSNALTNMQIVADKLQPFYALFESLPVTRRREIMESVGPKAAAFAVGYFHPELLKEGLIDLDWDKDIVSVDPDWYHDTDWPENRYEPTEISGYGNVSKIELWTRMFWLRRGEAMFDAAKKLVSEAAAAKK